MDIGRREVLKAGAVTAATAAVRGDQSSAPGGLEILPSKLSNPSETVRRASLALGNIATDPNDTTVTVMSGNLAGGRKDRIWQGPQDQTKTIELIKRWSPQICFFQEVHLEMLATLYQGFGKVALAPNDSHPTRGDFGNMFVIQEGLDIVDHRRIQLPDSGWVTGRNAAIITLDVNGIALRVLGTHFSPEASIRYQQIRSVRRTIDREGIDLAIGDFNQDLSSVQASLVARRQAHLSAPATMPSWKPRTAADGAIPISRRVTSLGQPTTYPIESDHLAVLEQFKIAV
jgi:endonuclease/exonuclease/phosphatase family metal-dependent hydrolase